MSRLTTIALEVLGVVVMLAALGAGWLLFKDGTASLPELAGVGGVLVFGALLVEPKRVVTPLATLWATYRGTKP